jgi:hypothetical protein
MGTFQGREKRKKRKIKRHRFKPGSLALTGAERDECSLWPTSDPDDVSNWIQLQPNELVIILKQNPSDTSPFIDHNSNYTKVLTSDGLIGWIWSEDLDILA